MLFVGTLAGAALAGCTRIDVGAAAREAEWIAASGGLTPAVVRAGDFALWSGARVTRPGLGLRVYIEGDGLAFLSPYRPSTDPTPPDPTALRLAARDSSANVLYLARPCQYATRTGQHGCSAAYWTTGRYAPEVIDSVERAISQALARAGGGPLTLVGFSGGGTVAALVAARRDDVARLVTVAANLDHRAWTRLDDSTPLRGSLNPPDFAKRLARVPQVHLVGDRDEIVPYSVTEAYRAKLPPGTEVEVVRFPEFEHVCCWVDAWPAILTRWLGGA